jgi:hypothetical protein
MEPTPTEAPIPETPLKIKKPRSEAQLAATQKALSAMTAARKARAVKQLEHKEEVKVAKKIIEKKIVDGNLKFATKDDIDSMRKELNDLRASHQASTIVKAMPPPKAERIVERVIERVPTASAPPQKLTGNALLDSLFFNK